MMQCEPAGASNSMVLLPPTCASRDSISSSFALTSPTTCGTLCNAGQKHQEAAVNNTTPAPCMSIEYAAQREGANSTGRA